MVKGLSIHQASPPEKLPREERLIEVEMTEGLVVGSAVQRVLPDQERLLETVVSEVLPFADPVDQLERMYH